MREAQLVVERCHRADHHRRRVALRDNPISMRLAHNRVEGHEQGRSQARQGLVGFHNIKRNVWTKIKNPERLLHELAVLTG